MHYAIQIVLLEAEGKYPLYYEVIGINLMITLA